MPVKNVNGVELPWPETLMGFVSVAILLNDEVPKVSLATIDHLPFRMEAKTCSYCESAVRH